MESFVIEGGQKLKGEVEISGAKNAALPIMAAGLLARGKSVLKNIPRLWDVRTMIFVLRTLGAKVEESNKSLCISVPGSLQEEAPYELVRTMRASVLVLGPLIARIKKARVSLPGGCTIGIRPINLHLEGLSRMGVDIRIKSGYIEAETKKLKGAEISFNHPSVGATENLLMAASLARGRTVIENASRAPEVVDLIHFLNKMGARIAGAGRETLEIQGVEELKAAQHSVIPDRIEAGTFMIAGLITGGELILKNICPQHLKNVTARLEEMGAEISFKERTCYVQARKELQAVDIETQPHPGFPTDLQPQIMSLMCLARGKSVLTENIFEKRFMQVGELERMGANIKVQENCAFVRGVKYLTGASVMASDIRAGACLILAGLAARGQTKISRIYHIDRGYEKIEERLQSLGASITRKK